MASLIELENVYFSSQSQEIVKNISLDFEEGKITALVGPSGCGKSTVLKLAAGIYVPSAGKVKYSGRDLFEMNRQENLNFRKDCSMVFQDSALWANQSLFQAMELPLRIHFPDMEFKEREKRIKELLLQVGYRKDTSIRPDKLSMGEQKLIAFARAFICSPKCVFLDEWTESLDEAASQRLIGMIVSWQKNNNTVIFVSHDFRIVKTISDFVIMIKDGQLNLKITKEQMDKDNELENYIVKGIES